MKRRTRQLSFRAFDRGGKRRGAGRRPKGERAGVSHSERPFIEPAHPLHVTLEVRRGIASLRIWPVHELFLWPAGTDMASNG